MLTPPLPAVVAVKVVVVQLVEAAEPVAVVNRRMVW